MRGAGSEGRMALGMEGNSWPQEGARSDGAPQRRASSSVSEVSMVPRK